MEIEHQPHAIENFKDIPRCGAKTRRGSPCASPCVHGKKRCRMHGGAAGSGAPKGNQNNLKHGRYTKLARLERRKRRELFGSMKALIEAGKMLLGQGD